MTPCSPLAVAALEEGLAVLADVRHVRMDDVARLDLGRRPVVWVNPDSSIESRCRALNDVLRVLTLGTEHTLSGQWVRSLRSVV